MGVATGGATYLGYKFVGVGVGHYIEKYSYEELLNLYDKYLDNPLNTNIDLGNNQNITPDEIESVVFLDTSTNEETVYSIDKNNDNDLVPEYKTDLTTGSIITLNQNQTISHIAVGTEYTTKELLQYNNLTEDEAKSLPVGFEVKVPKDISNLEGGYGDIKLYEGYDGSLTYYIPSDGIGSVKVVRIDKDGNVLQNDFDNSSTVLDPIIITTNDNQSYSDAKTIEELLKDPNNLVKLEEGTIVADSGEIVSDGFVEYEQSVEEQRDKRAQEEEEYIKENKDSDIYWGGVINTAIGQIGSVIIANNNFSNIEKISVSTTISSYFAKNDNISDIN